MNILQVHNKYKIPGGERTVVYQEYDLLKEKHNIEQLLADNTKEIESFFDKLTLVFKTHYNKASRELVRKKLVEGKYEVMHVHNFFPLLTPSIFDASREEGVPSVLTLHNYRLIYPNGNLQHNGKIDERPVRGSAYATVLDGVYRNSIFQTAVVAHMIEYHRKRKTWHNQVDCFICLTEFAKEKFTEAGLPPDKIRIKPNFVEDYLSEDESEDSLSNPDSYYLFVGRISEEKGIRTLLSAWKQFQRGRKRTLVIIGDGLIKEELEAMYPETDCQIKWMGHIERAKVIDYLKKAKAMIFPSECYEGMPMTILEAFSVGTPVISSDIGSQGEIVGDKKTGLHFHAGNKDSLIQTLEVFEKDQNLNDFLSQEARKEFKDKYSPEVNYSKIISIYRSL